MEKESPEAGHAEPQRGQGRGWDGGHGECRVSSNVAASPFQAQDTAVTKRLFKHRQHVDLIHHHM